MRNSLSISILSTIVIIVILVVLILFFQTTPENENFSASDVDCEKVTLGELGEFQCDYRFDRIPPKNLQELVNERFHSPDFITIEEEIENVVITHVATNIHCDYGDDIEGAKGLEMELEGLYKDLSGSHILCTEYFQISSTFGG